MSIETYRAALAEHRAITADQRSFSLVGVKDMDEGCVKVNNQSYKLKDYILTHLHGPDKKPIFTDVAPTKYDKEGRFLLLTHKDKLDVAQDAIDEFLEFLTKSNQHDTLALPTMKIARANRNQNGPKFVKYTNKITARFAPVASASLPAPAPTDNPWNDNSKRPVQMVIGCNNEFPPLEQANNNDSGNEQPKKQKQDQNTGTQPSSAEDSQMDDLTNCTAPTSNSEFTQRLKDIEDKTTKTLAEIKKENKQLRQQYLASRQTAEQEAIELNTSIGELRQHLQKESDRTNEINNKLTGVTNILLYLVQHTPGMPAIPEEHLRAVTAPTVTQASATPSKTSDGVVPMDTSEDAARSKRGAAELN